MKLRTITRERLYRIEEEAFRTDQYLTKRRTPQQLRRKLLRLLPDHKVKLDFTDQLDESEMWWDGTRWQIRLVPGEMTYHWLVHEVAHVLQGPKEKEEHSPAWLLHYVDLVRNVLKRHKAARRLLEKLT